MSAYPFVTDRDLLEAACASMVAANDPKLPLMRAAADGRVALAWVVHPSAVWPLEAVRTVKLPVLFLVGDDPWPSGKSFGPAGWPIARKLKAWVRAVIVHGAGGEPEHYREAIRGAEYTGRCAFIETSSKRATAWARYLDCPPTLLIVPRNGIVHPAPSNVEVRH